MLLCESAKRGKPVEERALLLLVLATFYGLRSSRILNKTKTLTSLGELKDPRNFSVVWTTVAGGYLVSAAETDMARKKQQRLFFYPL